MSEDLIQKETASNSGRHKLVVFAVLIVVAIVTFLLLRKYFSLEYLSQVEANLKAYYEAHPWIVLSLAFLIYVVVTGLSIPGATALSLVYAWFFGFTRGLVLIS